MFLSLHNHSTFSLLRSLLRVEEIVDAARRLGMCAVGMTDRSSLAGAVEFYRACLEGEPGVKPLLGAEVVLEGQCPVVLLAVNEQGYGNLCEVLSEDGEGRIAGLSGMEGRGLGEGLICLTGGAEGLVSERLRLGDFRAAEHYARQLARVFPERCYVELYYHQEADVAQNKRLAALAEVCGLPVVAGGSVHYLRPPDARAYAVLESIRTLTLTHEPAPGKRGNPSARHAFLTPGKAVRFFSQYPGAVENTQRISDACELIQRLVDAV